MFERRTRNVLCEIIRSVTHPFLSAIKRTDIALLRVDASPEEGRLPGIHIILGLA